MCTALRTQLQHSYRLQVDAGLCTQAQTYCPIQLEAFSDQRAHPASHPTPHTWPNAAAHARLARTRQHTHACAFVSQKEIKLPAALPSTPPTRPYGTPTQTNLQTSPALHLFWSPLQLEHSPEGSTQLAVSYLRSSAQLQPGYRSHAHKHKRPASCNCKRAACARPRAAAHVYDRTRARARTRLAPTHWHTHARTHERNHAIRT
jgi:hypothetical protein